MNTQTLYDRQLSLKQETLKNLSLEDMLEEIVRRQLYVIVSLTPIPVNTEGYTTTMPT